MIAQELLDALYKAQNETDLDQVAVWALSKYLQAAWKDGLDKNIRPFDLGKTLGNFYVDLSQHRLPEKIVKQTPETEPALLKFYGAEEGSLTRFWAQCAWIWGVTLEPHPAFAKEVKKYFDMLLHASLQTKIPISPAITIEPPAPVAAKSSQRPEQAQVSTPAVEEITPEVPVADPTSPAAVAAEHLREQEPAQAPTSEVDKKEPELPASQPAPKSEPVENASPRNAYLVLQGTRVIPLNLSFIKIGRQLDNHIILEDPRVSRSHAQIKLVNDRFVIFDMNSTGGTFVNGQRTSQSVLYSGDTISLAGVVFIYSQELPAKPGDIKIIELGSHYAADRKTAVMHKEEIKPPKKTGELPQLPKTGPLK